MSLTEIYCLDGRNSYTGYKNSSHVHASDQVDKDPAQLLKKLKFVGDYKTTTLTSLQQHHLRAYRAGQLTG